MSIPFSTTCLYEISFSAEEFLSLAEYFSHEEGTSLLYSGSCYESAQHSFLFLFPIEKLTLPASRKSWEILREKIKADHFWVGFLSYEMGCFSDLDVSIKNHSSDIPGAIFYRTACKIQFNPKENILKVFYDPLDLPVKFQSFDWLKRENEKPISRPLKLAFRSDTYSSYKKKIEQAKEWIREGEIYQLNLSQEFIFEGKTTPFAYFLELIDLNPAPFSAFLRLDGFSIVSSSPERLLCKKNEFLETRPIKGTMPRGKKREDDERLKQMLLNSEKNKAELLMITDLMRSDLGKYALPGSVEVKKLWKIEGYTNVFHLLSIIEAKANPVAHPVDILRGLFPGGSITGCPKLRAMQLIEELEKRARGIYTGSIGYFDGDKFDFNIAIRTLSMNDTNASLQLGGAIVIDSDPQGEFEETLHKGQTLFKVLTHELDLSRSHLSASK